ncbi:ABC transporter ATP-binding protein [Pseudonocardia acaciae]|uniref:ABC transporter ATP-binding protein n=1 Tax=Pseudonocardia acaciae TaxID=551276 RepID=UPI000490E28D|nr:ABC transporter ATP-binding protein [Pseudonocardia acaciae]
MNDGGPALRLERVAKRFGRRHWALREATVELPAGRVAALVGPNGAGKTTLLMLATGLLEPTGGRVEVFGEPIDRRRMPAEMSFLAQDKPLYPGFRVAEMLRAAAVLNRGGRWDAGYARSLVAAAGIGPRQRIRELSPGQRARVALAVALGRRPSLLLLDEPLAELDPLARRDVMGTLLGEVAESGMAVLMSSHVLADLEDACDHLVVLRDGAVTLAGDIDALLAGHSHVTGPADASALDPATVVHHVTRGRQTSALIHGTAAPAGYRRGTPTLDDLVMGYLRAPGREEVA